MPPGVLVGRDAEISLLNQITQEAISGRGRSVSIEGEPGIGKSALMDLLAAECERLGMDTVRCSAEEMEQRVPFAALMPCLGVAATPAARSAWLRLLLGAEVPDLAVDGISINNSEFAMTEAIVELVEQRCAAAPVALLIDDVQWADPATLLALHRLGRTVGQLPLLMVITYRSLPLDAGLERLLRSLSARGMDSIRLGPLAPADVAHLVARMVGGRPGRDLLGLVGGAAGNPLYIKELVAALLRANLVNTTDGVAELIGARNEVTQSLAGAVVRQLDFLSRPARDVLQVSAVLGPTINATELSVILHTPASDVLTVLGESVDAGLLTVTGDQMLFRHIIIRRALAETVPATARNALHLQAAHALAEHGGQVERVAQHLLAGQSVPDWALDWLIRAAQSVIARAPALAADLLGQAMEQVGDDDRGQTLRFHHARALLWAARHEDAEQAAQAAIAANGDPSRMGGLHYLLAQACFQQAQLRKAQAVAEDALAAGPLTTREKARFEHFAAQCRLLRGHVDPAQEEATAEAIIARRDADSTAIGLYYLSGVRYVQERMTESLSLMDRAIAAFGSQESEPDWDTPINFYRASILAELDRTADAENAFEVGLRQANRHGSIFLTWYHLGKARLQFLSGRWDDALAEAQAGIEAVDALRRVPALNVGRGLQRQIDLVNLHRGDSGTCAAIVKEPYVQGGGAFYDFLDLWAHALAWEAQGDPEQALDLLFHAWKTSAGYRRQRGLHYVCADIARLAVTVGDTERAELMSDDLREMTEREVTPTLRGVRELCGGLLQGDATLEIAAAETFRIAGRPLHEAYAHENAATVLAGQGRLASARTELAAALDGYD
ncbi:MAG TPA: AAA family ATPase, partial [Pilimelia sp.]|nr:AAA family ATPase [Pilimelia sp.]